MYARIADRRRDALHKLSTRLIRENQVVVIEDLTVRNMLRNRRLARSIIDAAWSQFRSMLQYKADWYGRTVIVIDRWCPSSKTCSCCGYLLDRLPLTMREWVCPGCGMVHDREVNAAVNILAAGQAASACGDGVRPSGASRWASVATSPRGKETGTIRREPMGLLAPWGKEDVNTS